MQKPNPSESGLPHPSKNIVAFRAKTNDGRIIIQAFDLDQQKKLKDVRIQGAFSFWTWASEDVLALVTNNAVYHLEVSKGVEQHAKIVDRRGNMVGCQIINYRLDPQGLYATISGKFCFGSVG